MPSLCLEDVRRVRWGKSYLWEIRFPELGQLTTSGSIVESPPEPPTQFSQWFPASSVQEPVFQVTNTPIRTAIFDFSIPTAVSFSDITLMFYDTIFDQLRDWLWLWVMHMFSYSSSNQYQNDVLLQNINIAQGGMANRSLVECIRPLEVNKLTEYHEIAVSRTYWVYPSGNMIATLDGNSTATEYNATFTIVSGMFTNNLPALT